MMTIRELRQVIPSVAASDGAGVKLRRAFGFKRSEARMREIAVKLRLGLERNGITGAAQDSIVSAISSFALSCSTANRSNSSSSHSS